ncbi:hypothetical protein E4T50_13705 [Aureobasidium sp. EXF-12298]|nr:hypothetical protein E4T50_13705 [Aureobasidium sp. EXF-12298]
MDLPQPPHHYQNGLHASLRVDTPMGEYPPAMHSSTSLDTALDSYSATELRQLLRLAIQKHPSLASDLVYEPAPKASLQASKSVNFVQHSNSVWHTLNAKQSDPTREHQHADTAVQKIANDIHGVTSQHPQHQEKRTRNLA